MREWLVYRKLSKDHPNLNRWVGEADKEYEIIDGILCRRIQLKMSGQLLHRAVPEVPKILQSKVALRAHTSECAHNGAVTEMIPQNEEFGPPSG